MSGLIYWNYSDSDSKKIFRFISSQEFTDLRNKASLSLRKEYKNFENEEYWKQANPCDLLMFFTHGEEDAILKFRYKQVLEREHFLLVSEEDIESLSGKKIIAICCNSAKGLGQKSIISGTAPVFFIGFEEDLIYNENFPANIKTEIYRIYNLVFLNSFTKAYEEKWSAEQFVRNVKQEIIKRFTEFILTSSDSGGPVSGAMFHFKTANSLIGLGKVDERIFTN